MTAGLTVVQWADLTGRGFSPHDVGPSAPREYWGAAERLLQADLSQPPEGIRSTVGHPVWTLRRVDVQGRRLWCFVVQGRRGPFGVAGTCRFAFATDTMSALDAWTAGAGLAAADQQLPAPGRDAAWFQGEVLRLLGGIVTKQPAIPVGGDPAQVATIIPAALKVLPERELRGWSWSTCMLQRPDSPELRVVSGGWPEEFRREEPHRADSVAQCFHRGPVTEREVRTRLGSAAVRRGFEVLVHYAATGRRPGPDLLHDDRTLAGMLTELGTADHVPDWRDVPSLLATPGGRQLAGDHRLLVRQWATHEPTEALGRLRDAPSGPLAEALLAGIVEAQRGTPDNLLDLPTAAGPGPAGWSESLAALLLTSCPQAQQLRAVTGDWITAVGVLGNEEDRLAARAWLRSLGLTPEHDRAYFPPDPDTIITELNTHHRGTAAALAEVELSDRPVRLLASLGEKLEPLPGPMVATVICAAAQSRGTLPEAELRALQPLIRDLTRTGLRGRPDERWVDDLLETAQQQLRAATSRRLRRMLYGALEALLEVDAQAPRTGPLLRRCRVIGYDNAAPARIAAILEPAAGHDQETGTFPVLRPRRRRTAVYTTGIGTAVAVLGVAGALVVTRTDGAPPAAGPPPPVASSAAPAPPAEVRVVLPPRQLRLTQRDEQDFATEYGRRVMPGAVPAAVVLVGYGGDQNRARELRAALDRSGVLAEVPISSVTTGELPPPGVELGSLVGTVYFNR